MPLNWLQMSSWLWFNRSKDVRIELSNGQRAKYLGWRRANVVSRDWYGPALRLLVNGQVTHGWDPATVVQLGLHVPLCGDCKHWHDVNADQACPRIRHAYSQGAAYLATGLKAKKELDSKGFEGTSVSSPTCSTFAPMEAT